ncbi:MAG: ATP-binding cassette domain-containing protein, partial [Oscillospiraceae bacterium]|nr:ATP-binding cassette domain-containing protein [Oscillospiraceae bacterium]
MIKFENVTKKYEDFTALENFDLEIKKGCAYGLLGTNGAGKSTLLRILSGVYRADKGKVTIGGEDVYDNPSAKQKLLLISDETSQFNGMTLLQMKKFYKTFYRNFSDEMFDKLNAIVNLPVNKKLSGFSKGMKRQAAVICGIAARTDYLF